MSEPTLNPSLRFKICILGDFAVGKTSLVGRFINNVFNERYLTTVGVKVDTKMVETSKASVKLVLWDMAGNSSLTVPAKAYLQGAHGFLVVCDGTRRATLNSALSLLASARELVGSKPAVLLVNKQDLAEAWEVDQDSLDLAREKCSNVMASSAKTGVNVERAFKLLAEHLLV